MNVTISTEKLLYTMQEACQLLAISKSLGYRMIKNGELPTVRFGKAAVRISASALRQWVEANTSEAKS